MNRRRPRACLPGSRPAFTMVELLVVITLIALLVGILLPALGKAKTNSYGAVCLSNSKMIGAAVSNYLTDQKQRVPLVFDGFLFVQNGNQAPYGFQNFTSIFPYQTMWSDRLVGLRYLDAPAWEGTAPPTGTSPGFHRNTYATKSVFTCPDAPQTDHRWPLNNRITTQYYFTMMGGWRNNAGVYLTTGTPTPSWDANTSTSYGWLGPDTADRLAKPAQMIIAGDRGFYGSAIQQPWMYDWWSLGVRQTVNATAVTASNTAPLAHNNSPRVLYLDGSAGPAPRALIDLQKMPNGSSFMNTNLPEVQRAARYFHPAPPSNWAY